ncbi:MAG TPA: prefoldin subunit beta [Candidatus Thermoplasmatota archaeon]|nr:prefoldin subunit beta [Candidatus Thermoplasmatota archaeon]
MAEPTLSPQVQQQLQTLQALNQQLQGTAQQRAQYEAMKAESEQALEALQALPDEAPVYRSVGSLLVQDKKGDAQARLKDDAETMEVRITRMQKQEMQLREQMTALQAKIQAALQAKA